MIWMMICRMMGQLDDCSQMVMPLDTIMDHGMKSGGGGMMMELMMIGHLPPHPKNTIAMMREASEKASIIILEPSTVERS